MAAAAAEQSTAPADREYEIVVLGSGPGGAVTACVLAEAGRDVLLVEEGPWLPLGATEAFSRDEMRRKYRSGGVTVALGAPAVAYAEGRCVGGGSEVNSGLYHRTPPGILARWRAEFDLRDTSADDLAPHFEACERELHVSPLPGEPPPASRFLERGAARLGWRSQEVPRWFRYHTTGTGEVVGEKQSMTETYVPRAVAAGCRMVTGARALTLERRGGRWRVRCEQRTEDGARRALDVHARTVFVACGAIQTPTLLRRSGIRRNVGTSLHLHPTIKVVARCAEAVNGPGVPAHQVKEFAPRLSLGCSISTPPHLAMAMTDHPEHLRPALAAWERHVVYYATTCGGVGSVRPLPWFRDPLVRFALAEADLRDLGDALRRLCECLLAAGAEALYPTIAGSEPLRGEADLARLPAVLPRDRSSLMTIHAFSTAPMGEDRARCATSSHGAVHEVPGLYVADASLLCSPPSVNPQGTIMAVARRNALRFLERGGA